MKKRLPKLIKRNINMLNSLRVKTIAYQERKMSLMFKMIIKTK
jgi:hypothetical protein